MAVLGLVCVAAVCVCVVFPHGLPLRAGVSAFMVSAVIAFVHLRHIGLAAIVAFAPIPGLLIAHALGAPQTMALCYLPGLACAMFLADDIAGQIVSGVERGAACKDAFAKLGGSAAASIAIAATGLAILSISGGIAALAATIGAGLSAILIVPLAATFFPFGEDFVTRANRLREWRERMLDPVTAIAEPRWAMSAAGIALIFAVLGYFGARPVLDAREYAVFAALLFAAGIAGFGLTWEWRRALALPIILIVLILIGLWGFARVHESIALLPFVQTLGICAVPLLLMAAEAARHLSEDGAAASSFALLRKGPATILFFAAAIVIPTVQFSNTAITAVIAIVLFFGCAAALFWLPAFAGALETLIPRKSALETRYRVR
jgi:hypothetical protein